MFMLRWTVVISVSVIAASAFAGPAIAAAPGRSATASPANTLPSTARATTGAAKSPPNIDAMMRAIDKMFPPQPEPDPVRLGLARTSAEAMWPEGAYAKMMTGFVGNMFTGVMQMNASDLPPLGKTTTKTGAKATESNPSVHDQAIAKDPYFDQRMTAIRSIVDEEIAKIAVVIDPRMRDGLARSMAHRFDARQLADINAFFATPSGHAFANEYVQLWFEPDTLRSMMAAVPEMIRLMPDAMQKIKAVNEKFPKPAPSAPKTLKHD